MEVCSLSNKVYNVLKYVALVFLPALTTLVGVTLKCFNVPCTDTVITIMSAVDTFLGTCLGISTAAYNKKGE